MEARGAYSFGFDEIVELDILHIVRVAPEAEDVVGADLIDLQLKRSGDLGR